MSRWDTLLGRAYEGEVTPLPASPAQRRLRDRAWALLVQAFPEGDPRRAWASLPEGELFSRLSELRVQVHEDPELTLFTRDWLVERHAPLHRVVFDPPRLRGIFGGQHHHPKARMAYAAHRDIWYANPEAQLNLWLALHPIPQAQAVAFWPESWRRPVPNDSEGFDYSRWTQLGGWQKPNPDKVYPHASACPGEALQMGVGEAEALAFSAALLHGALGFEGPEARFTLEIRLVPLDELERQRERLRGDNRCQGSTLGELRRASDLRCWSPPAPRPPPGAAPPDPAPPPPSKARS